MINIRPVTTDDIASVCDIISSVNGVPVSEYSVKKSIFDDKVCNILVGYADGVPFAVCIYSFGVSIPSMGKKLIIETIYVKPEYRGEGIGKLLLQLAAQKAMETCCTEMVFISSSEDVRAEAFFVKNGADKLGKDIFTVPFNKLGSFASFSCTCGGHSCNGNCSECKN